MRLDFLHLRQDLHDLEVVVGRHESSFQEKASKKPVWQDEDDEVDEAIVDVPLHRRKMYIRRVTDARNQKITPKVFFM